MNAEFNWWLLIVGLVVGAALTWLVMADSARRESDVTDTERPAEAVWIADVLSAAGRPSEPERVEEILRLHADYLEAPPPDDPAAKADEPHWQVADVASDDSAGGHRPDADRYRAQPEPAVSDVGEPGGAHQVDQARRVPDIRD
jgi:hypothetical protein